MANSGQFAAAIRASSLAPSGTTPPFNSDGVAEVVDVEELGRERVAPIVALAFLGIDMHAHGLSPIPKANLVPSHLGVQRQWLVLANKDPGGSC